MSEKIRVLIVDDLPETRENVRKLLQFESDVEVIAQAGTGEQAVEMAKQHRPDIILMDINMPGLDGIGASQAIVQNVPSAQIIIMSVQSEADYLRRAMLAGARDFLMKPFSGDELVSAIRRVHQMRPADAGRAQQVQTAQPERGSRPAPVKTEGNIVSIYSPKGGSGCTTIAVNLAVALAEQGHETLLIDGSLQFGDVAVTLNMKPSTSIIDLIDRMTELDADLVSSVVVKHQSGLKVLMAPPRPEMADLVTEDKMKTLLELLRESFEFIIIDTSSSLNDVALSMLDTSDRIFLVTQQSLPALKNVSRFFDLAETLNYERKKVLLIVNRLSEKAGISVTDISDTLKRPVITTIPVDDELVSRAADQGRPLVSGKNRKRPITAALNRLAEVTLVQFEDQPEKDKKAQQSEKAPLWKRLFGFGQRSEAVG
ncbi:MAG TPA: response regulator [Candidatus Sulfomarinibacteraceae bacterium]|nr:response regulator [Candidatus Sulfomarinibacteraceae bacterium]